MGTTVVAIRQDEDLLHLAYVGDSRIYRLRQGKFEQVTRDHSLINLYEDNPELASALRTTELERHRARRRAARRRRSRSSGHRDGARRHVHALLRRPDRHGRRLDAQGDARRRGERLTSKRGAMR